MNTYSSTQLSARDGSTIYTIADASHKRSAGGDIFVTTVVTFPNGRQHVGRTTSDLIRNDGLGTQYQPTRWQAGSYGNFETVRAATTYIAGEVARGYKFLLDNPTLYGSLYDHANVGQNDHPVLPDSDRKGCIACDGPITLITTKNENSDAQANA